MEDDISYKPVTVTERRLIRTWRQAGLRQSEIAHRLVRPRSTISREIARNKGGNGYQPEQANRIAQERARRPEIRRFTEEVKSDAEGLLREGWTPEMISGRARYKGRQWVCKETIYKHIYADSKTGGDLWENLPRAHRNRPPSPSTPQPSALIPQPSAFAHIPSPHGAPTEEFCCDSVPGSTPK
jgi:transposase, IS30 family